MLVFAQYSFTLCYPQVSHSMVDCKTHNRVYQVPSWNTNVRMHTQSGEQTTGQSETTDRLTMPLVVVIVPFASPPSRSSHGGSSVCVSGTSLLFDLDRMMRVVLVTVVWTTPSVSTTVSTTSVVSVSAYGSNSSKLACKSTWSVSAWSAQFSEYTHQVL